MTAPTHTARPDGGPLAAGLDRAAGTLTEAAAEVRRLAGELTAAAAASRWRSLAADACQRRLADLAHDLLAAAGLLDRAAATVDDHARTATHRASLLATAAADLAGLAAAPLAGVLS